MERPIVVAGEVFIDVVFREAGRCWIGIGGAGTIVRSLIARGVRGSRLTLYTWSATGVAGGFVRHLVSESGISLKSPPLNPDARPLRIRVYRRRDECWRLSRCDKEGRWSRRQLRQALAEDLSVFANSAEIVLADFGRLGQLDADDRFPPLCGLTTKEPSWLSLPVEICCVSTDDLRLCAENPESLRLLAQELAKDARAEEFVLTGSEHGAVGVSSVGSTCVQVEPTQNALTAGAGDWLLGALVKARLDGTTAAAALQGAAREATATCRDDVVGGDTPELATEVPAAHISRALGLPLDMDVCQ